MRSSDLNNKYQKHIEPGFFGLEIDIPEFTKFVDKLLENLILLDSDFQFSQIKLKFGEVRFYYDTHRNYSSHILEERMNEKMKEYAPELTHPY